jgi:Tol biopolymer transport system component
VTRPRRSIALSVVLASLFVAFPAGAAFPGSNGDIAFLRRGSIRIVSPVGTIGARIGPGYDPAWSPDGTRIAFELGGDVWTAAPDGTQREAFLADPESDLTPAWSPDGDAIVVSRQSDTTSDTELFIVPYPGGSAGGGAYLTDTPGFEESPAWSPDGTRIAYSYYICETPYGCFSRIAVYDIATSTRTFLTPKGEQTTDITPDWSPDGSAIVFASNRHAAPRFPRDLDIYTVPANGGDITRVLNGRRSAKNGAPVWSPDGERLLYIHSTREARWSVRTIRWDGSDDRALARVRTGGYTFVPDWQSRPAS